MLTKNKGYNIKSIIKFKILLLICEILQFIYRFYHYSGSTRVFSNKKRILVLRLDHIGDVILSTPALRALRHSFPDAEITLLLGSWALPVIEGSQLVDEVICYDAPWFNLSRVYPSNLRAQVELLTRFKLIYLLRKKRFNIAIDLRSHYPSQSNAFLMYICRAKIRIGTDTPVSGFSFTHKVPYEPAHEVEHNLNAVRVIGADTSNKSLQVAFTEDDNQRAYRFLKEHGVDRTEPVVAIHPCSGMPARNWIKERYAVLADRLINELGVKVMFTGSKKDIPYVNYIVENMRNNPINAVGHTDLKLLFALLHLCSVVVTVNTVASHIAAAVNTPVIALFSGTNYPEEWGPYGDQHIVIQKKVTCMCYIDTCFHGHHECMELITIDEVLEAVKTKLKK